MIRKISRVLSVGLALVLMCFVMTGCAATGEAGESGSMASTGFSSIIMLVVMVAVFYFFMIRPESKKKKQTEEMRNSLSVGDKITTIGGMVGRIVDISGDLVTFETGEDRVRIQVTKWAISANSIQKQENNA